MTAAFFEQAGNLLSLAQRAPGFFLRNAIAEWQFYAMMAAALGIGLAIDIRHRRAQKRYFSPGFRTDLTYAAVELSHVVQLLVLVPFTAGLNSLLEGAAPWLRVDLALPVWLQLLLLFVFLDFWTYWYHRALHSNRYLWQFHKVHHSQKELSAYTNFRVSLLDRMLAITALSIPTFMIGGNYATSIYIVLLLQFHQLIVHIDADWKFGWLERILVTPRFHVTHHSTATHHGNRNYGAVLSVWDHIFKSAVERGRGELEFGLTDERVPEGYVRQLLVPAMGVLTEARKDLARLLHPAARAARP